MVMYQAFLLQDLAAVMVTAAATTLLCRKLQQPVVIGYLLAGLLIGPYTPPFSIVHNLESIHTMAELGLVFLMFYLGLEFNLPKLGKVGMSAALAAILEVVGMFGIGYMIGNIFGWNRMDSIFLGAILSVSSTTIIVKVFMDLKMTHEDFAQAVFGILILEDIVAILLLSILSGLSSTGGVEMSLVTGATLKIMFFVILFLIFGLSLVPRFIHWTSRFHSMEMTGIVILGLCLLGALFAYWFGFSVALGAFLMGAVVAASQEIEKVEEWFAPVRDMFSAIFFVSAGMLIQPKLIWEHKTAIAVVVVATLVGKILSGTAGAALAGFRIKTSAKIGFSLAQIGEFSFVIASLGVSTKVASEFLYPLAITVSSLTTFCTPYLIRYSDSSVDKLLSWAPANVRRALDHYAERVESKRAAARNASGNALFSKYLLRLAAYVALLICLVLVVRPLSEHLPPLFNQSKQGPLVFVPWVLGGLAASPLIALICKYATHSILLLSTMSPHSPVLRYFNIQIFYNVVSLSLFAGIGFVYLNAASSFAPSMNYMAGLLILMLLAGYSLHNRLSGIPEWLERLLDEVLGLATSEPTRQAVLRLSSGKESVFEEITRQVAVKEGSPIAGKSIRDLRIRELTGASIVAVYRQGKHIPNPSPDTEILAEDILIFLGGDAECDKAQDLLQSAK